ncbi:AraC family transcriptional regulator [Marinobacterium rhizophilum]|uniref:AraC family transcriptional regulator n=1 Tax=Marinobacterium rhizophilum TaxID=420402 RepID=A0ABY5HLD2_9GAMM|nr:AraC family transcriptional regulator [Marinobacterium rhizophilum]UTW12701.1 AraC family transcriptional regulator [Marinobacterium rhizophilum]
MSSPRHSISVHYARTFITGLERRGHNCDSILQRAGLHRGLLDNPQVRITPHQLSSLVQQLWHTADDEFLALGSRPCRFGIFPLMARQALYGTTLRSVLRRSCHFYNLVSEAVEFKFEEWDDCARLSLRLSDPSLDTEHSLCEFLLLIWHRFPGWMIGRRVELSRMCFTHARPRHSAEYRLMFPAPVAYEQPFNGFEFSREQLDAPIVQTVANLRSYMKRAPLDWFSRQAYYPIYTRRVLDQLERADTLASTTMEDTATALHMTTRTLRRKLTDEGTSFQDIKDGLRRDTAIHLLSQPSRPVSSIARELGFSEPSAFTRAFRHWTGVSPSSYRKRG